MSGKLQIEEIQLKRGGTTYAIVDHHHDRDDIYFQGSKVEVYSFWLGLLGPTGHA